MEKSAKWLLTGFSDPYTDAEISLPFTSMPMPALWLAKASSFLRQRAVAWSAATQIGRSFVFRFVPPCPPPVVRHCEFAGLSAVGVRVWRRSCECTASCSCVSSALQWMQFGVWGWRGGRPTNRPQSIDTIALASESQFLSDLGGD